MEVLSGSISSHNRYRLIRNDEVIETGLIVNSLKQNKKNINMVKEDEECGMIFENYDNFNEGDLLEAYDVNEKFENITKTNKVVQCYTE